jgi:DNA-binding response OmpR family regulator
LILLDVNLGGVSGFQVLEWVRQAPTTRKVPVILLTARDQESEKVKGLRLGADDYVTKPFSEKELMARVETVLRRAGGGEWAEARLESGPIAVDIDRRQVTVKGKPVDLRVLEFDLLCLFLKSPERVHSYNAIADAVWGEDRVATRHTIAVTLSRLREKLGSAGDAIEPVPNIGYRFMPPTG